MISKIDNKEISQVAGVIAGLAYHFQLDPFWLRIGTAFSFFLSGSLTLIIYIILAIIMPKEYVSVADYKARINAPKQ